jgi:predicted acyl esterase
MAKDELWREDILWRDTLPLDAPIGRYPGFRPRTETLQAGSVHAKGGCPLSVDLICERDVAVMMRDGITIYADVFRPAVASHPLPAIVAWSPYGKGNGGNQSLDDFPFRAGVPRSALSGLQMWEAPDPAYWCAQGYAVVNVDARGAYCASSVAASKCPLVTRRLTRASASPEILVVSALRACGVSGLMRTLRMVSHAPAHRYACQSA